VQGTSKRGRKIVKKKEGGEKPRENKVKQEQGNKEKKNQGERGNIGGILWVRAKTKRALCVDRHTMENGRRFKSGIGVLIEEADREKERGREGRSKATSL